MRACQLCGCASWGPIGNPESIARLAEFIVTNGHEFVRCDGCKSIGRKDLLQEAPQPMTPPDAGFDVGAFMKPVMATLMPPIPAPPTRTERLVLEILRGHPRTGKNQSSADYAQWVVALARVIEWELDHPTGPSASEAIDPSKQPWLVLSFPAREEFERWVTGFLDAVVWPGYNTGPKDYSTQMYERAITYATQS